jgi:hypothetical protein
MPPRRIQEHPTAPDELSLAQGAERSEWGLPSQEGELGQHPGHVLTPTVDAYAEGIFVGHDLEENAQPAWPVNHLVRARVDAPRSYELPHEATHRRYEPPRVVGLSQSAIGTLMFAAPNVGLHYVKLIALSVSLAANGAIQFVQGSNDGVSVAALGSTQGPSIGMGAMNLLAGTPLILPPAELQNPWLWTAPDQALGLITTGVGAFANGWALIAYSPYDQ